MKISASCLIAMLISSLLISCEKPQTKTTKTSSKEFSTLEEKQVFLEKYVNFRRTYEELEYSISYVDGGSSGIPGPTEWDIRIKAKVPANELIDWHAGMTAVKITEHDASKRFDELYENGWTEIDEKTKAKIGSLEWYKDGRKLVAIDAERRIVLYRNYTN